MPDDYASTSSTTGRVTVGSSTTGTLESSGDHDWFAVSLSAGTAYQFRLNSASSSGLSDPYLRLYSSGGTVLASDDDSGGSLNSLIRYTATSSGTYYLDAGAYNNYYTGAYVLYASTTDDYAATTSTTGRVTVGSSSTGTIESSGDHDWFAVSLTAGQTYTLRLTKATSGGLSDPYLRLYASNGSTVLAYNDDGGGSLNSLITYTATSTGTYYLDAADLGSGTGAYTVSVSTTDDYAATTATTGSVTVGSSTTGTLETSGDHDWFAVSLTAGTAYQFRLNSASTSGLSDPYLRLYSSGGTVLASDDDSGGSLNSLISYTATSSGTFYLDAGAYNNTYTGAYTLSASSSTPATLSIAASNSPSAEGNSGTTAYTFTVTRSGDTTSAVSARYTVAGSSSNGASATDFYGGSLPSGTVSISAGQTTSTITVYVAGDTTAEQNEGFTVTLSSPAGASLGTVYSASATIINDDSQSSDDYAANSSTSGTVGIGSSSTGNIETSGDHDWFAVSLTAGNSYQFRLVGSSLGDPYLRLYSSSGSLLAYNDDSGGSLNSLISYTATASGTYYLDAAAYSSGTGTYTISTATTVVDDYLASTATSGRVTVGSSATGTIETASDNDWFAVSLTAGQTYRFALNGNTLGDPYLRLYNGSGSLITYNDDGSGYNSLITYTATTSGTYFLGASAAGSGTGTYTLSATSTTTDDYAANSTTTGSVAVGSSSTGRIETTSDHDWFAVSLTAGQTYQFRLNASTTGGLSDPYLRLYSSTGTLLSSDDDSGGSLNSLITYSATSSGTYYLDAAAYSSGTGNYTVSASVYAVDDYAGSTATSGRVTVGSSAAGNIETANDADWFAVTLSAGQTYQFRMNSTGLANPYLRLYSSGGTQLSSDDNGGGGYNALITYAATSGGTYYLGASANGTGTGTYTVTANATTTDDYGATTATTGSVTVGSSAAGNIETSGDHDWFAVSLTAGTTYRFALNAITGTGGLYDPYLRLYAANGATLLASNDDGGGSLNSLISYTATSSGTFYLDASAYSTGTGAYSLSASVYAVDDYAATSATTGQVTVGSSSTGRIETVSDRDWFAVSLTAGQSYQFTLTSNGLSDPYLSLYSSSGSLLASNNNNGSSTNSLISYTATATGTFYLSAADYSTGTGAYTVAATQVSTDDYAASTSTSGTVAAGSSATGNIETSGDHDWFAIGLTSGTTYQFRLTSSGLNDPYLRLRNAAGTQVAYDDDSGGSYNSLITYTATSSGTFYLDASAYSTGTGTYTVSATAVSTDDYTANTSTTGTVSSGGSASGRIETSGDADWFAITLTSGQTYQFHLDSASGSTGLSDPYLRLYNSSGSLLTSDNNSGGGNNALITYTATSSSTFYLSASANGSGTGSYSLSASTVSSLDDYTANSSTTGSLTVGGSASTGRIEAVGDHDWFAVSLTSGQRYEFHLNSTGLSDPYMRLYNSSGTLITSDDDSGGNLNSAITYTATSTGTYYIDAAAYSTGTGSYSVTATSAASSPSDGSFFIKVDFAGDTHYQRYFDNAAARWAQVITGDLPSVTDSVLGVVDDLEISASVVSIDGAGGILGQAGATGFRSDSTRLPYKGMMQFDSADMASMEADGTLQSVILHEMGHVLGLSSYLWRIDGLLSGNSSYQYTGSNALAQYRTLSGNQSASYVQLETNGGSGTAGSHWSESVFNTELMTGYAEAANVAMPLSILTIGALADLGYQVSYSAADPYSLS